MSQQDDDADIRRATRRVLFRPTPQEDIPGAGTSAASRPERHTKVKVTINLDGHVVAYFKERAQEEGCPYQTLINQALREHVHGTRAEIIARDVREILSADPQFIERLRRALAPRGGADD